MNIKQELEDEELKQNNITFCSLIFKCLSFNIFNRFVNRSVVSTRLYINFYNKIIVQRSLSVSKVAKVFSQSGQIQNNKLYVARRSS